MRILGANVGPNAMMPADGALQFSFDRYLLPSTVSRQSVVLADVDGNAVPAELAPIVTYDPIARTVTLAPPTEPWLTQGTPYKVRFVLPDGDDDSQGGLRAIDRATLYPGQPLEFAFLVGPPTAVAIDTPVSFCRDVLPIFATKCSSTLCHGTGDQAAASLILNTSAGVAATALNRVAQGVNRGASSAVVANQGRKFGIDMPLIDPGSPGNSWLLYKIELAPPPGPTSPNDVVCQAGQNDPTAPFAYHPLAEAVQRSADDTERGILSNYVIGSVMPFPSRDTTDYATVALTFDEREKVRAWISSLKPGGTVPECGGCGEGTLNPTDAGTTDSGVTDAGADAADAADASDAADQ